MNKNKFVITILMILLVFALEVFFFNKKIIEEVHLLYFAKGILKSGFYASSYIASLIAIALIIFIRDSKVFVLSSLFVVLSYLITSSYLLINGRGFGLSELQVLINESSKFSADVWNSYSSLLLKSTIGVVLFISALYFLRNYIRKNNLFIAAPVILSTVLLSFVMTLIVVFKTVNTNTLYPVPMNLANTLIFYATNAPYNGEREVLTVKPKKPAVYKNIIWMIDESISGHYLSINGFEKDTTPYLNSIKDKFINLGQASSTANCSAESNLTIMSGIQLNQLPDEEFNALKKPNIFQYAKNAGYTTHYISGQSENKLLQNYMTDFDLKYIDNFYQPPKNFTNKEVPEEDLIIKVKEGLEQNTSNFMFVVKRGAHFHWEGQYPTDKEAFKPTLNDTDNLISINKEKAINSYANAIRFKVDDFFKSFYELTDFHNDDSTLIVYTSDHGQSIVEGTSNGTHCDGIDPNFTQGIVPLVLFTNAHKDLFAKTQVDSHSLFQLFPTTLDLMGYQQFNGKSLLDGPVDSLKFFSGDLFGRTSTQTTEITIQ